MTLTAIDHIRAFLACATPQAWLDHAVQHIDLLLLDHAHCEKKAAAIAMNMMYRYPEKADLQHHLSRLAREELRHFEQVIELMNQRQITFRALKPSSYASQLRAQVRKNEPGQFVDLMIIFAFIEARSCERFAALSLHIDDKELAQYYQFLLRSESRHFQLYLNLAKQYGSAEIQTVVQKFAQIEAELIQAPDTIFRFHSGVPMATLN